VGVGVIGQGVGGDVVERAGADRERYAGIDRSGPVFSSCGEADATESVVPDDEEES
jgi:hypothetical protein